CTAWEQGHFVQKNLIKSMNICFYGTVQHLLNTSHRNLATTGF
ncbi:hypothetical protein, partial [uncultured Gammaproteobacteria bacterium]